MTEAVAILAGGKSLRMGTDKAQLRFEGTTLLERAAQAGLATGRPVFVLGRERPDDWILDDVPFLPDETPDAGPIGGLATALRHAERVSTLACDMPLIDDRAIRWLWSSATEQISDDGLAVLNAGEIEPLFSIYTVSCLPIIERRMTEGRRSLRGLIEAGRFGRIDAPPEIAARLVNVNTPGDYAALVGPPAPNSGGVLSDSPRIGG